MGTLQKASAGAELNNVDVAKASQLLKQELGDKASADEASEAMLSHVAALAATAANMKCYEAEAWSKDVAIDESFAGIIDSIRAKLESSSKPAEEVEEEDEDGVDLYKGSFSLAYGTLTLLRDTKLRLKRNRFYGLLGPNQCGKTTLMRAIANEQLEGFPKRDELKSVFVEHELEDEEIDVQDDGFPILSVDKPGWWWVRYTVNEIYKVDNKVDEDTVKELMKSIGFGYPGGPDRAANLENPVTSYSGGWRIGLRASLAASSAHPISHPSWIKCALTLSTS